MTKSSLIVAFANANGGTLMPGVQESSEQPREAVGLAPLPRCEELARRLLAAAEDIVNGIEHRVIRINHPWTNGQVERMNRTIKDATVMRYHYDSHDQLEQHLQDFVSAYNFSRRLKTLKGLAPYEFICKRWTSEPE